MKRETKLLLEVQGITKVFPGVKALDNVTFSVNAGEVHGLVGENGAGKSTLMAVASGALVPEEGRVRIDGKEMRGNPELARELGLAIVRQEPALMPDLTVAENLYLGVPKKLRPKKASLNDWARDLMRTWHRDIKISGADRVASLNPEQRFIVEIVKALAAQPKVLVLDEPTEHLGAEDVERLFAKIRTLVARQCAVIYISHRIREVQFIAERLTVLRDGQSQGTYDASKLTEQDIVELIVGGTLDREFPPKASGNASRSTVLEVAQLEGKGFAKVSMALRRGEIVGLAGIDGNGQREFMRALAGLSKSRGAVTVNGKAVRVQSAKGASQGGIRYVPGDRHREGIFGELSVRENFSLRSLARSSVAGFLSGRRDTARAAEAVQEFAVKTASLETPIRLLSGGNQQKLVLSSVLASRPAVMLVDEPTQGVDIGARMEIYKTLRATAASGTGMVIVSSDATEVAGLCDRVLIFSRGQVVKELRGDEVTEHNITSAVLTSTSVRSRADGKASPFWKWAAGDWAPIVMLCLAIGLLGAYAASANEFYLSERNMTGLLGLVATLALVAFGQQMLMLVGGIDLSVGPLMGLVVVIQSFYLVDGATPEQYAVGWAVVLAVAIAVGAFNWFLVDPLRLHPMVATLATFMMLQAVSLILRPVPGGLIAEGVMDRISATLGFLPLAMIVATVFGVALEYGLFKCRWGIVFRGFGSRAEAARVAGVRPRLTLLAAYVGCSALATIAAIPMMAQVGSGDPAAGADYTLTSIAAAVIGGASLFGGRGSFLGALLGAMLITQVNVVTTFLNLSDAWQSYLLGAMILVAVAIYSKSRQIVVAA